MRYESYAYLGEDTVQWIGFGWWTSCRRGCLPNLPTCCEDALGWPLKQRNTRKQKRSKHIQTMPLNLSQLVATSVDNINPCQSQGFASLMPICFPNHHHPKFANKRLNALGYAGHGRMLVPRIGHSQMTWVVYDFIRAKWIFVGNELLHVMHGLHQKTNTLRQATSHARLHGATNGNETTSCQRRRPW